MIENLRELNEKVNAAVNFIVKTASGSSDRESCIVEDDEICKAAGLSFEDYLMYKELIANEVFDRKEILDVDFVDNKFSVSFNGEFVDNVMQPPSSARMAEIGYMAMSYLAYREEKDVETILKDAIGLDVEEAREFARAVIEKENAALSDIGDAILENDKKLREREGAQPVGTIHYHTTGEVIEYFDKVRFLRAFADELYTAGANSCTASVVDGNDLELRYELDKIIYNEFGERIAPFDEWLEGKREIVHEDMFEEEIPESGYEIPQSNIYFPTYYRDGCVIELFSLTFEDALDVYKSHASKGSTLAITKREGDNWVEYPLLERGSFGDKWLRVEGTNIPEVELASLKAKKVVHPFDRVTQDKIDALEKEMGVFERGVDMSNDLFVGKWRVHLVPPGGRYGLDNYVINKGEKSLVEFYDFSQDKDKFPYGQYVTRYLNNFDKDDRTVYNICGLCLDGGLSLDEDVDGWELTGSEMSQVFEWLDKQAIIERDGDKTPLDKSISDARGSVQESFDTVEREITRRDNR